MSTQPSQFNKADSPCDCREFRTSQPPGDPDRSPFQPLFLPVPKGKADCFGLSGTSLNGITGGTFSCALLTLCL